jgi:tRNA(Ile)-lysidine synthase
MFEPCARIGVGVSGGFDSVALLHILRRLAADWQLELTVLHLNHGLRGEESDGDEAFVRELALSYGLPVAVERAGLIGRSNLEERARGARYEFFGRMMCEHRLACVAVGHTQDDQAETVLMRIGRGVGPDGLAAIRPVTREGIVRPLVELSRDELREIVADAGLRWREDSSNADLELERNLVRTRVMPALRGWNPHVGDALARLGSLAQDDLDFWEREAGKRLAAVAARHREGLVVSVPGMRALPVAVARRVVRAALREVKGDLRGIGFEHVDRVVDLVQRCTGDGMICLPGVHLIRSFDRFLVTRERRPGGFRMELAGPGDWSIPGSNQVLHVRSVSGRPGPGYNTDGVVLDWEWVKGSLELRSWQPGDAYQPAGSGRSRKLKEMFHSARIPSWERLGWPMITKEGHIIWTRLFGPAEGMTCQGTHRPGLLVWEDVASQEPFERSEASI